MQLENNLSHQLNAIYSVRDVFENVDFEKRSSTENPAFDRYTYIIKDNICKVQNGKSYVDRTSVLANEYKTNITESPYLNLDIKMETGTGKTYCYFRTMFELNKNYGINKFILLVPSIAIKEGVKYFYNNMAFKTDLESLYGANLYLYSLDAEKNVKKNKKSFPLSVLQFTNDENTDGNTISVLLINSGMIENSKMLSSHYDQATINNFYNPYEAIKFTRPFLIIDEPHRFKRDGIVFKRIQDEITPPCVIRFGATFPEVKDKKTKNLKKDYENLLYNLGSADSFNKNLVKGIAISYPEIKNSDERIKILEADRIDKRPFVRIQNMKTREAFTLGIGDSLKAVNENFDGVKIDNIVKSEVYLSTGGVFHKSDILIPEIYGKSYQDVMLELALSRHFEKERENFRSNIKTLSLFFIDSITSIRGENGSDGYLLSDFKLKLKDFLENQISDVRRALDEKSDKIDEEYLEYLKFSLSHIDETCASYFSADNSSSDEEIKAEIDKVLKGKDIITKFERKDGIPEVTRFIFSKWTLKEGWDNPNIFVIAKLRTSGSEISKLQEVGRGLRLPIDKYGKRITGENFTLEYLVDAGEKDFATRLIREINGDTIADVKVNLTLGMLVNWAMSNKYSIDKTIADLKNNEYIEGDSGDGEAVLLNLDNIEAFKSDEKYSSILEIKGIKEQVDKLNLLQKGKVIDKNKKEKNTVSIKKAEFNKLKNLWKNITSRYFLKLENITDDKITKMIYEILKDGVFEKDNTLKINKDLLTKDKENGLVYSQSKSEIDTEAKSMPYSLFLKKEQEYTNIPLRLFHKSLVQYAKECYTIRKDDFNYKSLNTFVSKWKDAMLSSFTTKFTYIPMNVANTDTTLTENGEPRKCVSASELGIYEDKDPTKVDNYIYDSYRYDSDIEKATIRETINSSTKKIEVFGKIPKNSIKIPTLDGTYSPDFMYVVYNADNNKHINLVIETKGVDSESELRGSEKRKIDMAKKFFETLTTTTNFDVSFKTKINKDGILELLARDEDLVNS